MAEEDEEALAAALAMSLESPAAAGQAQEPAPAPDPAAAAVKALRGCAPAALAEAGTLQVLSTLLGNLVKAPGDEKFRRVKLGNARIVKALGSQGAEGLLLAAGFARGEGLLEVPTERGEGEVASAAQRALDALGFCGPFLLSAELHVGAAVRCVCALPGGGFATGAMDNAVRLHQPAAGTGAAAAWAPAETLLGHERRAGTDGVLAVCSLKGEAELASGGRDGRVLLWRAGTKLSELRGHGEGAEGTNTHVVSCLGLQADGALLSGGWDKTARVWQGEQQVAVLRGHALAVNAVVGLPNGDVATASGDQSVAVWRGQERLRSLPHASPVRALCACGGTLLASAANDGLVRLWDAAGGRQLAAQSLSGAYLLALAHCPGAGELAAGAEDGTVSLLSLEQGAAPGFRLLASLRHCSEVYGLAFLTSGDLVAACGDGACAIWTRSPLRAAPPAAREDFASRAGALAAARSAGGEAAGASGSWDLSFPVELGGRKMRLQWNRGEQPEEVARRFCAANGLESSHVADVVAFVTDAERRAQGGPGAGGAAAAGAGAGKDFSFPVEVADGRRLTISWNRGDDPQQVALAFAQQHGIGPDELPSIVGFVQQASGMPPVVAQQAPPSPEAQQSAMLRVMELGFSEASARAALEASGWSVEAAIQRLLG